MSTLFDYFWITPPCGEKSGLVCFRRRSILNRAFVSATLNICRIAGNMFFLTSVLAPKAKRLNQRRDSEVIHLHNKFRI